MAPSLYDYCILVQHFIRNEKLKERDIFYENLDDTNASMQSQKNNL